MRKLVSIVLFLSFSTTINAQWLSYKTESNPDDFGDTTYEYTYYIHANEDDVPLNIEENKSPYIWMMTKEEIHSRNCEFEIWDNDSQKNWLSFVSEVLIKTPNGRKLKGDITVFHENATVLFKVRDDLRRKGTYTFVLKNYLDKVLYKFTITNP